MSRYNMRHKIMVVTSIIIMIMIIGSLVTTTMKQLKISAYSNEVGEIKSDTKQQHHLITRDQQCKALKLHEEGNWQHKYFFGDRNISGNLSSNEEALYSPLEINWLHGRNMSADWVKSGCAEYENTQKGLMYTSKIGNQCGCQVEGFQPSHSVWGGHDKSNQEYDVFSRNPSVRLMNKLARANQTLCFFGDSIDKQFYAALRNNLNRILLLKQQHHQATSSQDNMHISVESIEIPVTYTDETGYSYYGNAEKHAFRYLEHIEHTMVTIGDYNTSFSYFKSYGWSPMHTSFMDDCSVVIANLGLHYDPYSGALLNQPEALLGSTLAGDFRATVTYLLDFTSSNKNRIAIWRSALPQHFSTAEGYHRPGKQCSLRPRKEINISDTVIQNFNKMYNAEFAKLCVEQTQSSDCAQYEHICTVNRTSLDAGSLYRYYLDTKCCQKRMERLRNGNALVTGRILRWNIADLFDVPEWHASNGDCSHFCYVPSLYDAAFERLELLLPD